MNSRQGRSILLQPPTRAAIPPPNAPVAQLDRALPSEGRGHRFESCRVRQASQILTPRAWTAQKRSHRNSAQKLADFPFRSAESGPIYTSAQSGGLRQCRGAWLQAGRHQEEKMCGLSVERRARGRHHGTHLPEAGAGLRQHNLFHRRFGHPASSRSSARAPATASSTADRADMYSCAQYKTSASSSPTTS